MALTEYKSLRGLARDIQSNLQKYAPEDTGNLKNKLGRYNTINTIIGENKYNFNFQTKSYDLKVQVEVAPDGAEYGQWFNDPPKVDKRTALKRTAESRGNWNFGKRAIDDAIYKNLNDFAEEIEANMAAELELRFSNL